MQFDVKIRKVIENGKQQTITGTLLQFGVPQKTLEQFLVKDGDFK